MLGNVLTAVKRAFLRDLLERNTTGAQRIRATIPRGWAVADKADTGDYETLNDIAVVWLAECRRIRGGYARLDVKAGRFRQFGPGDGDVVDGRRGVRESEGDAEEDFPVADDAQ